MSPNERPAERPRDRLGRPLPLGSAGVEPVSDEPLPPEQTLALARALLRQGRPFSAHEVLEGRWKSCPPAERELWQGLAQLAVGLTHAERGNLPGAARLLARGASHLEDYADTGGPTYGVGVRGLAAWARRRGQALMP